MESTKVIRRRKNTSQRVCNTTGKKMKRMDWALSTVRPTNTKGTETAPGEGKVSWCKRPVVSADNSGKTPTVGSQGKSVPASHFTRKSAARATKAVDSDDCLSAGRAGYA